MTSLVLFIFGFIAFSNAVTVEEATALCDFVNSTNIHRHHPEWDCANGKPTNDPCPLVAPWANLPWYGLSCTENATIYEWQMFAMEGLIIGTLPDSIGNFQDLNQIWWGDNTGITGTLPSSIGKLKKLRNIQISNGALTGTVPRELGSLSLLDSLRLVKNKFTGTIPEEIGNLSNMMALNFNFNQLTGTIPSSLGNFKALQTMYLNNNFFSGTVPSSMCEYPGPYVTLYLTGETTKATTDNPNLECYSPCLKTSLYKLVANGIIPCVGGK